MFRRRSAGAPDVLDDAEGAPEPDSADMVQARPGQTPKKGAPTPKRSEAQARRRQPYQAPTDRKAATRESRQRDRDSRQRKTLALQRGEEWALPVKDKGPVRAFARDYVDARHGLGEYYMFLVILLIVLLVIPSATAKLLADVLVAVVLVVMATEGWWVGRQVLRVARERFPGQSTRGVRMYAALRGIQIRRMRVPKPRVNRGDAV